MLNFDLICMSLYRKKDEAMLKVVYINTEMSIKRYLQNLRLTIYSFVNVSKCVSKIGPTGTDEGTMWLGRIAGITVLLAVISIVNAVLGTAGEG